MKQAQKPVAAAPTCPQCKGSGRLEAIGPLMAELRERLAIDQVHVRRLLDIPKSTLSRYETGQRGWPVDFTTAYVEALLELTEEWTKGFNRG